MVSIGGAVLIIVVLFSSGAFENVLEVDAPRPVEAVAKVVFWPVTVCLNLSGPGPSLGPPEKHMHEGSPVQYFAAVAGIGFSWAIYSSMAFFIFWLRSRRRHV